MSPPTVGRSPRPSTVGLSGGYTMVEFAVASALLATIVTVALGLLATVGHQRATSAWETQVRAELTARLTDRVERTIDLLDTADEGMAAFPTRFARADDDDELLTVRGVDIDVVYTAVPATTLVPGGWAPTSTAVSATASPAADGLPDVTVGWDLPSGDVLAGTSRATVTVVAAGPGLANVGDITTLPAVRLVNAADVPVGRSATFGTDGRAHLPLDNADDCDPDGGGPCRVGFAAPLAQGGDWWTTGGWTLDAVAVLGDAGTVVPRAGRTTVHTTSMARTSVATITVEADQPGVTVPARPDDTAGHTAPVCIVGEVPTGLGRAVTSGCTSPEQPNTVVLDSYTLPTSTVALPLLARTPIDLAAGVPDVTDPDVIVPVDSPADSPWGVPTSLDSSDGTRPVTSRWPDLGTLTLTDDNQTTPATLRFSGPNSLPATGRPDPDAPLPGLDTFDPQMAVWVPFADPPGRTSLLDQVLAGQLDTIDDGDGGDGDNGDNGDNGEPSDPTLPARAGTLTTIADVGGIPTVTLGAAGYTAQPAARINRSFTPAMLVDLRPPDLAANRPLGRDDTTRNAVRLASDTTIGVAAQLTRIPGDTAAELLAYVDADTPDTDPGWTLTADHTTRQLVLTIGTTVLRSDPDVWGHDRWHHHAFSIDRDAGTVTFHIDGTDAGTVDLPDPFTPAPTYTQPALAVGRLTDGTLAHLTVHTGTIDVAAHLAALTATTGQPGSAPWTSPRTSPGTEPADCDQIITDPDGTSGWDTIDHQPLCLSADPTPPVNDRWHPPSGTVAIRTDSPTYTIRQTDELPAVVGAATTFQADGSPAGNPTVTSSNGGSWSVTGGQLVADTTPPSGTHTLTLSSGGTTATVTVTVLPTVGTVNLPATPITSGQSMVAATVTATVTDVVGTPTGGQTVRAVVVPFAPMFDIAGCITEDDGTCTLEVRGSNVPAGSYTLAVDAGGERSTIALTVEPEPAQLIIDLPSHPTAGTTSQWHVVDVTGQPIAGPHTLTVTVHTPDGTPTDGVLNIDGDTISVADGISGTYRATFTLAGHPDVTTTIRITVAGTADNVTFTPPDPVGLVAGETRTVTITATRNGRPAAGAALTATVDLVGVQTPHTIVTGPNGNATITIAALPTAQPSSGTLTVTSDGASPAALPVAVVAPHAYLTVTSMDLTSDGGTLTVNATGPDGRPADGLTITAAQLHTTGPDGTSHTIAAAGTAVTDPDGHATLGVSGSFPPGTWTLEAALSLEGRPSHPTQIPVVIAAQLADIALVGGTLQIPQGQSRTVTFIATDQDGQPVPYTPIDVTAAADHIRVGPAIASSDPDGTRNTTRTFTGPDGTSTITVDITADAEVGATPGAITFAGPDGNVPVDVTVIATVRRLSTTTVTFGSATRRPVTVCATTDRQPATDVPVRFHTATAGDVMVVPTVPTVITGTNGCASTTLTLIRPDSDTTDQLRMQVTAGQARSVITINLG